VALINFALVKKKNPPKKKKTHKKHKKVAPQKQTFPPFLFYWRNYFIKTLFYFVMM